MTTPTFESTFERLQTKFESSNKTHATQVHNITENIKFDDRTIDEAKDKLITLAMEQEKLATSNTLRERVLGRVSKVPFIGNLIGDSVESLREQRIEEESISGIVGVMFSGLRKQVDELIEVEQSYIKLYDQTKKNIEFNKGIKKELDGLQENGEVPMSHHTRVLRLQTQTEHTLFEDTEFLRSLESSVIPGIQMAIQTILQKLPRAESNLLTNAAVKGGIDKVLALVNDTNEAEEISNTFVASSNERTQEALLSLIKMNNVSEEQLRRIEDNAKKRIERQAAVTAALIESKEVIKKAHTKVLAISKQAEATHQNNQQQLLEVVNAT